MQKQAEFWNVCITCLAEHQGENIQLNKGYSVSDARS